MPKYMGPATRFAVRDTRTLACEFISAEIQHLKLSEARQLLRDGPCVSMRETVVQVSRIIQCKGVFAVRDNTLQQDLLYTLL